ncbi:MAG: DUF503 domain-containing protein [Desulfuromonadales bacterium]|nr:DUF503 domain-containing protein [Desulfuromonadales bacterium]
MIVGTARFDLRLHGVQSLKQKRSVIRRLLNQLRSSCPVSVAEVGHADLLQRAIIGACIVSTSEALIDSVFRQLEAKIDVCGSIEMIDSETEHIHYGEKLH